MVGAKNQSTRSKTPLYCGGHMRVGDCLKQPRTLTAEFAGYRIESRPASEQSRLPFLCVSGDYCIGRR